MQPIDGMKRMKLSEYRALLRDSYLEPPCIATLRNWAKAGRLPAWQSPTGRWYILVPMGTGARQPTGDPVVDAVLGVAA